MTRVGLRFHGREPSEPPRLVPHRGGLGAVRLHLLGVLAAVAVAVAAGCGGGPDASVGVTVVDDEVVVRAKACGEGGIERADVVAPSSPGEAVWTAVVDEGPGTRTLAIGPSVDGYRVEDRRSGGVLPEGRLRVLVEGPDGASWGGPRFVASELHEGTLRVAGRDVPLDEWEAEGARCPEVGLGAVVAGGLATAVAAGLLWLVVRLLARAVRRRGAAGGSAMP